MVDHPADLEESIRQFRDQVRATRELEVDLERRLVQARDSVRDLLDVQRVLRFLAEKISQPSGDVTARLVTTALQSVFVDEDLVLVTENSVRSGRPVVDLKVHDRRRGVVVDPMDACGGGPRYLIGILLRVLAIVRQPQLRRLLILDEPLKEVSRRYHRRAVQLLKQICEPEAKNGLGFTMLVVSHDRSLVEAAHRSYRASADEESSLMVREEDPSDEFFSEDEVL